MTHELISPAAYARQRGVSRAAVHKALKRCRIPLAAGKLDPLVADTLWKARTDPEQARRALAQQRPEAAPAGDGADKALSWRERIDRARAMRDELQLAKERGEFFPKAEVLVTWQRRISEAKTRLLAIPNRVGARTSATALRDEVLAQVDAELYEALLDLSGTRGEPDA